MTGLRLVFAGTPSFGLPALCALEQSVHQIQAIYTQPDRPAGRGRQLQASAVKVWALQQGIAVFQPPHFKESKDREALAALKPDALVVMAYGLILPKTVLEIPRLGCINVHASILPNYRGASPIQEAILQGSCETGVSIMQMDVGMDTGSLFCTLKCPIDPLETAGTLHDKLAQLSVKPLLDTLDALAAGQALLTKQDNQSASYASKIHKEDARINWDESVLLIERKIRAFNPWPIAYTFLGKELLRIHKASPTDLESQQKPGTILHIDKKGIRVATKDKALNIEKFQFPGTKVLTVADWLNSKKDQFQVGFVLQ